MSIKRKCAIIEKVLVEQKKNAYWMKMRLLTKNIQLNEKVYVEGP